MFSISESQCFVGGTLWNFWHPSM